MDWIVVRACVFGRALYVWLVWCMYQSSKSSVFKFEWVMSQRNRIWWFGST
jgi:hypothetical protein